LISVSVISASPTYLKAIGTAAIRIASRSNVTRA
jgi:hypothetical protein